MLPVERELVGRGQLSVATSSRKHELRAAQRFRLRCAVGGVQVEAAPRCGAERFAAQKYEAVTAPTTVASWDG